MSGIDYKRFLGLTTSSEVEPLIYKVERKAKLDMADKLKSFHEKYEDEQKALESSFDCKNIEQVHVNFWDDFYDDGFVPEGKVTESYAYIEDSIPDIECHRILSNLLKHIQGNDLLPTCVKMRMHLSDSAAKYPNLIDEHKYMLTKTWEIRFTNITHELLDNLIKELKTYSDGSVFHIYSES